MTDADKTDTKVKPNLLYWLIIGNLSIITLLIITLALITDGDSIFYASYHDRNDIFMDYFNSIFDSMDGAYTIHHVMYPPLITLLYGTIGNNMHFEKPIHDGFDIRDTYVGLQSYLIIVLFSIALYYLAYVTITKRDEKKIMLFPMILLSYPFLFSIMRGNNIIIPAALLFFFIVLSGSDNRYKKYLSYVILAIIACFKVYPAIFGLMILRNHGLKESLICLSICAAILIVPFAWTDGNILMMIENATTGITRSDGNPVININDLCVLLLGANTVSNKISTVLVFILYGIVAAISVLFKDMKKWEFTGLLASCCVIGLGTSAAYTFIFMIVPLVLFLMEEKDYTIINVLFIYLFTIILMVFPGFMGPDAIGFFTTLKGLCTMAIAIILIVRLYLRNTKDEKISAMIKRIFSPNPSEKG